MFPAEIFSRTPCISISVHVSVIFEPWKWTMVQECWETWEFVHKVQVLILNYSKVYKLWHLSFTYIVWTGLQSPTFSSSHSQGSVKTTPLPHSRLLWDFKNARPLIASTEQHPVQSNHVLHCRVWSPDWLGFLLQVIKCAVFSPYLACSGNLCTTFDQPSRAKNNPHAHRGGKCAPNGDTGGPKPIPLPPPPFFSSLPFCWSFFTFLPLLCSSPSFIPSSTLFFLTLPLFQGPMTRC